eukprot:m.481744 g.481744  ORF g.481744 m.481744 type:complete len:297 (-) comp21717_c0_seq21:982-1872(-)
MLRIWCMKLIPFVFCCPLAPTKQPGWWFSWPKIGIFGVGLPFVYSPNLVWFACAALIYCCFPYDLEAAARWDDTFIMQRLYINLSCGILWYSWWHLSIYYFHFASRKFNPKNNGPTLPRLLHNMWYCVMGLVIWTAVEVTMIHLMGSGKLLYTPNEKLLTREGFSTLWWVLAMPAFRDLHFYFAHRTIHIRVLYTYVHSLHHRNNDPEPFSGLCMHPIEHMYYFSCVGLSFFVVGSPFLITWNLVHAVLAPAAGFVFENMYCYFMRILSSGSWCSPQISSRICIQIAFTSHTSSIV